MPSIETPICNLLNISKPIFQAPMAGAVTPKLISAVAHYGGLGAIPMSDWSLEKCEQMIDATQALTDKPLAVNIVLEWSPIEKIELALRKGIKIFWFCWGDCTPYIDLLHQHDALVMLAVGSAAEAKHAVANGIDVITTQGVEAGGHVWGQVASMPLIPTVVDAVDNKVPVIAAGGIMDGRGLAAALALGAQGIVLGSRLLASNETGIHPSYQQRLIAANETDTVYTDIFEKGWPNSFSRVLNNDTYKTWQNTGCLPSGERPGEHDIIAIYDHGKQVERYSRNLPAANMKGDLAECANYVGQGVGLIQQIQSVEDILQQTITECVTTIEQNNTYLCN